MMTRTASLHSTDRLGIRSLVRGLSQVGLCLVLAVFVLGFVHKLTSQPTPSRSLDDKGNVRMPTINPPAYEVSELYLPQSLLALAKDETVQKILQDRDTERMDAFLESRGLQESWFLVLYRPINVDGSTWLDVKDNFDCKRYHVHSSQSQQPETWRINVEHLVRAMAKAAGRQPDTLVLDSDTDTVPQFVAHFDTAKIVPIPDDVMIHDRLTRQEVASWKKAAELAASQPTSPALARRGEEGLTQSHDSMAPSPSASLGPNLMSSPAPAHEVVRTRTGG